MPPRQAEHVPGGNVLIALDPEDCADLLASAPLGRLAVVVDGRPEVFPVNHVYDRASGCVAFASQPGTKLDAALRGSWVAFEADGVSADGSRGWSVLVVGRAEVIDAPETIARMDQGRDRLWRTVGNARWVRVVPSKMTGRRICAADRAATPGTDERNGSRHAGPQSPTELP